MIRAPRSCIGRKGPSFASPRVTRPSVLPSRLAAQRDGGRSVRTAARPSAYTVVPWSSTALAPRSTSAATNGAGESLVSSSTATSPVSALGAPYTTCRASPLGIRIAVCTTGMPSTRCWRTAASRAGTRHRSSAPIHQSSSHPAARGATRPRPSTDASRVPPATPMIVVVASPGPSSITRSRAAPLWPRAPSAREPGRRGDVRRRGPRRPSPRSASRSPPSPRAAATRRC